MTATPELLIAICTYRRPALAATLASLRALEPCGLPVRIAVADNDAEPSAQALVQGIAADHPLPISYLHAPQANISIARNALLDHAAATGTGLLAFIDDDELAAPGWLAALVGRWRQDKPAAVLGPVQADYLPSAPAWMARARVHDTMPVVRDEVISTGYSGNALLDVSHPAVAGRRFDLAMGRSGGEDTAFFAAVHDAGGSIAFAPEAVVREAVPADRASLPWLLRRRFRMGQTHAALVTDGRGPLGRIKAAGLAGGKAAACAGMALLSAADPARRNPQIMRAALHVGVVAAAFGARPLQIYAAPPAPARDKSLSKER